MAIWVTNIIYVHVFGEQGNRTAVITVLLPHAGIQRCHIVLLLPKTVTKAMYIVIASASDQLITER